MRPRFAVIPTNGRACLKDCLMAVMPQVDFTILIYTVPFQEDEIRIDENNGIVLRDTRQPPNISRWWNQGLHTAKQWVEGTQTTYPYWDVAVINDDVIVPEGWFDAVSEKMRQMRAAAACSGGQWVHPVFHTHVGPVPLNERLQGFAFILAGEKKLRANEDLPWYFSDDYIDWESRKLGGIVMIPGFHVDHLYPNGQMTPELHQLNAEGAAKFLSLYGRMPW